MYNICTSTSVALGDMQEQLRKNQEEMEAMEASWEEKMKAREEELRVSEKTHPSIPAKYVKWNIVHVLI